MYFLLNLLAPVTVATAAELVRANANSVTWKSIKLYGHDRNVWQNALLKFIDKDKLPEQLGGKMKRERKEEDL